MRSQSEFPEMEQLLALLNKHQDKVTVKQLCQVECKTDSFPVHLISLGNASQDKPAICFVGGVHGVERIGSQVVLSFMDSLLNRLDWDKQLQLLLEACYLVFIPIVNPSGMVLQRRANGNGVDLMRNSPSYAKGKATFMVGGQRISRRLPWYQGNKNGVMETESQVIYDFAEQHLFGRPFSLVLDCHSGFGHQDRIWFPYAKSATKAIEDIGSVYRLRQVFFESFPHQNYLFEPQTKHYVCNGDLWDYCYEQSLKRPGIFIPLTLEMGSWRWLKKNPLQVFSSLGLYHPMKPHRVQRVLRRHLVLMEFLINASYSWRVLHQTEPLKRATKLAKEKWFNDK
ncbi:DUF2817 domain-containing protein [Agarivorans sp. DSG3-1]|uniref:DUF2817 domain-containing protein n=1 Tax=Agarivorans sp. DSG3-1 TaxID=3342249 RepID=UPI00398EEE3D